MVHGPHAGRGGRRAVLDPRRADGLRLQRDTDGTYVRRRFTLTREFQLRNELPNIAAWLANPDLGDPRHRSAALSLSYLALRSPAGRFLATDAHRLSRTGALVPGTPYPQSRPGPLRGHLQNLGADPRAAAAFLLSFGAQRFLVRGRRAPGFFAFSASNTYPLQFHGEHLPLRESRVRLSRSQDALGAPRLDIDLRFADADVDGVVRAHQHWDDHLRRTGTGRLQYRHEDVAGAVRHQLGGGFHQIGTTRMSARAEDGVVDGDLGVHGYPDLHVASSSSFVTSGQANPTLTVVAFAVRLSDHLRRVLRA